MAAERPADPAWAWAPYVPDAEHPWDLRRAGHLYRRAAFGADWDQLQQALREGPQRTIDRLLHPEADVEAFNAAHDGYETPASDTGSADGLRAWWLRRMIETPHPLLEKVTLFWHGYFATSNARVNSPRLMRDHASMLRRRALGSFAELLQDVSHDPAVLLWLGADANRKSQPNPSYPRHLLAEFTLGDGGYSEKDVAEAARAFTGWFVVRKELRYLAREHDGGVKEFLGQSGNWGGKDVVRIALEQPATARFVVRKLYRWLVSETDQPPDELLRPLADSFAADFDVARLVGTMLRSNLFFSDAAYRQRVKGPVEFAMGIIRGLEGMVPTARLGADLAQLGQNLYHPSTVKGWAGGRHWLNDWTVLERSKLARALLAGSGPYGKKLNPSAVAARHGHAGPESAGRFLLDLFVQGDVEPGAIEALRTAAEAGGDLPDLVRRFAHGIVTLPEFQLA